MDWKEKNGAIVLIEMFSHWVWVISNVQLQSGNDCEVT